MANGGAFLAIVAAITGVLFNFSLHKIEEGTRVNLRKCTFQIDGFIHDFYRIIHEKFYVRVCLAGLIEICKARLN